MGQDKALLEVRGRPMAVHVCAAIEAGGCLPVVVVGGDAEQLAEVTGKEVLADAWPGAGPLGGVIVALRWFAGRGADGVVIAACDLVDLNADAVRAVARGGAATVAVAGRRHPSLARWPVAELSRLETLFESGVRSLHAALEDMAANEVTVDEAALRNVNTRADLTR
jgi:molybdopterin-guanine dinucleotide biosynthesis protein A